MGYKNGGNMRF